MMKALRLLHVCRRVEMPLKYRFSFRKSAIFIASVLVLVWNSVAVHADSSTRIALAAHKSENRTSSLKLIATLDVAPGSANVARWSATSARIAVSGLLNEKISVFDVRTKRVTMELSKRSSSIVLDWSNGDKYIAVGMDGTPLPTANPRASVDIWDGITGRKITTILGPHLTQGRGENDARSASFNRDGNEIVVDFVGQVGKTKPLLHVYDVRTGAEIRSFGEGRTGFSTAPLVFSPDGKILADANQEGKIRIWQYATGVHLRTIAAHSYDITALAFSPDGAHLISGTHSGRTWGHLDRVTNQFVIKKIEREVRIWDVASGNQAGILGDYGSIVRGIAVSPDGKFVATVSNDGFLRLWALESHALLREFRVPGATWWTGFSPDGTMLGVSLGTRVLIFEMKRDLRARTRGAGSGQEDSARISAITSTRGVSRSKEGGMMRALFALLIQDFAMKGAGTC